MVSHTGALNHLPLSHNFPQEFLNVKDPAPFCAQFPAQSRHVQAMLKQSKLKFNIIQLQYLIDLILNIAK